MLCKNKKYLVFLKKWRFDNVTIKIHFSVTANLIRFVNQIRALKIAE
jgi:hypothetical protein